MVLIKVKKYLKVEEEGKPDKFTYQISGARDGVEYSLTLKAQNEDDLSRACPAPPGGLVELRLLRAYKDITVAYRTPEEAARTEEILEEIRADFFRPKEYSSITHEVPGPDLKPPNVMALIDALKGFDYSRHKESIDAVKARMAAQGYDLEGLEEALGVSPEEPQEAKEPDLPDVVRDLEEALGVHPEDPDLPDVVREARWTASDRTRPRAEREAAAKMASYSPGEYAAFLADLGGVPGPACSPQAGDPNPETVKEIQEFIALHEAQEADSRTISAEELKDFQASVKAGREARKAARTGEQTDRARDQPDALKARQEAAEKSAVEFLELIPEELKEASGYNEIKARKTKAAQEAKEASEAMNDIKKAARLTRSQA